MLLETKKDHLREYPSLGSFSYQLPSWERVQEAFFEETAPQTPLRKDEFCQNDFSCRKEPISKTFID